MTETPILGYHWLRQDRRLNYPPHTLVEPGQRLTIDGAPVLCERGYHASRRAIDALGYAPGPIVCRVAIGGQVIEDSDKLVGTERTVLWLADATTVLHEFACWCAEQALTRERAAGRAPDPRSWAAIAAKRAWLRGEITDGQLAAARDAAWAAAGAAAGDAAGDAARAAARAAARDAARDAAWAAARAAAWDAAGDAARAAARAAARDAVWAAARAAARAAAGDAQNNDLERRLLVLAPESAVTP